jgi:phosphatidate phosphatase APP1
MTDIEAIYIREVPSQEKKITKETKISAFRTNL